VLGIRRHTVLPEAVLVELVVPCDHCCPCSPCSTFSLSTLVAALTSSVSCMLGGGVCGISLMNASYVALSTSAYLAKRLWSVTTRLVRLERIAALVGEHGQEIVMLQEVVVKGVGVRVIEPVMSGGVEVIVNTVSALAVSASVPLHERSEC